MTSKSCPYRRNKIIKLIVASALPKFLDLDFVGRKIMNNSLFDPDRLIYLCLNGEGRVVERPGMIDGAVTSYGRHGHIGWKYLLLKLSSGNLIIIHILCSFLFYFACSGHRRRYDQRCYVFFDK
jgi:hypothetical protein